MGGNVGRRFILAIGKGQTKGAFDYVSNVGVCVLSCALVFQSKLAAKPVP